MSGAPSADTDASRLPLFQHIQAKPGWRAIDLLSDLHLQSDTPKTCQALFAHLNNTSADAIFILGDLFEVWVGDDSRLDGFEREMHERLSAAARHKFIAFMVGNRDFLVGEAMLQSAGVQALADPTVLHAFGQRILLTHGDALCLSDTPYQRFRAQVRSTAWQSQFLSLPLAERRELARQMRQASEQHHQQTPSTSAADIDADTAVRWLEACETPILLHGHTHHPGFAALDLQHARWVTSDWDFDGPHIRGDALRVTSKGIERIAPCLTAE